jgi:hypothetical protein
MYRAMIIFNNVDTQTYEAIKNLISNNSESIREINKGIIILFKSNILIEDLTKLILDIKIGKDALLIIANLENINYGDITFYKGFEQAEDDLNLDNILDKINLTGYESLTIKEKKYLENYGK